MIKEAIKFKKVKDPETLVDDIDELIRAGGNVIIQDSASDLAYYKQGAQFWEHLVKGIYNP